MTFKGHFTFSDLIFSWYLNYKLYFDFLWHFCDILLCCFYGIPHSDFILNFFWTYYTMSILLNILPTEVKHVINSSWCHGKNVSFKKIKRLNWCFMLLWCLFTANELNIGIFIRSLNVSADNTSKIGGEVTSAHTGNSGSKRQSDEPMYTKVTKL